MISMQTLRPLTALLWIGMLATSVTAGQAHTTLPIPFAERFDTPTLDAAWAVDVSKGNTIEVVDGALVVRAASNTYAHIERPLSVDYVRASCAIQPAPAVTWCTSLFVYWNPGNWCQFGIIDRDGGHYYVLEMIDQKSHEYTLGACTFDQWHHIAIEVGGDCIRYLSSEDGSRFKAERIARRPNTFAAAPALLIVGKGHGGPAGYPASDLDNDYATAGAMATSRIKLLRVEPLAWDRLRTTPEEQAAWEAEGLDRLGDAEMADGDPTFESVARHFPPMKYPREVVGVKDHPYDIGVAADAALQLNSGCADANAPIAFFEIGEPAYRFGTGAKPCTKHLLNGYMPIVVARDRHDGLELEQTIVGHTQGCSPDEPLFAFVRLRVLNADDAARSVAVRLRAKPAELKQAPETWSLDVSAHGDATLYVKVPFAIAEQAPVGVAATEFDAVLQEAVKHWETLVMPGTRFEIPEPRVQDAYRAWIAYNFLNVDKRDGVYHICDGAGFYEQVYGYSAALYCLMLDLMGYHEQAETYLDSLLTFQRPDGLFYVNFGHTDTGTLLHVMSEHYRITGDAAWLRRVAPNMIAMCNWIIERRPESMAHTHGRRAVVHGLIRFRPYCDYELAAFDYYADAYLCRGMRETADVFAAIGLSDEAKRIEREYEAYRKDILISMDAATITHDGMRMLPLMPDTHFLLKETGYTANGYYGLVASCLLEAGILPAHDPRTDLLVDMLRRKGGLMLGVCQFFGMIDHAYTYGYWNICFERDEIERVILGLYGSMAHGMTHDTYSAVECTRIRTGANDWTLPHTYSNTKQVRLLRNMLVLERDNDLLLAWAAPRPWLAGGKRLAVQAAPTRFGPVSYAIEPEANGATIGVHLEPPTRKAPDHVRLRLRHPNKRDIAAVDADPKVPLTFEGDTITLPKLGSPVDLTVRY